jgi:glycosyltransferase involved in cell wall biosynthesis
MMRHRTVYAFSLLLIVCTCRQLVGGDSGRKNEERIRVRWFAPFYSGGGYSSEAFAFASAFEQLNRSAHNIEFSIAHHGDSYNGDFMNGLRMEDTTLLEELSTRAGTRVPDIAVCHSEPGAWHAPYPKYHTFQCPPSASRYKIGRTMFETDSIPSGWVSRLNYMDEVWVPTEFSRQIFLAAGVEANKLITIGEPVDTDFFAPPAADVEKHRSSRDIARRKLYKSKSPHKELMSIMKSFKGSNATIFLFVGKWETRKGVDILLKSYQAAFTQEDNVCLLIVTAAYHSTDKFREEIQKLIREGDDSGEDTYSSSYFPCHYVISKVPQRLMPALYSAANALVVPSHGEGWGRPHVEAMACGTPVIATQWSGPTEFLKEENGYPLRITGLVEARYVLSCSIIFHS